MSESLAGVTFLAFGNGSPDVFSTFAAIKSNSGSLAVGELIGAAGFITAVVSGSMALVRPFRVAKRSFVRDVGFFIFAVAFSMVFVANGKLELWECAVMVGFYIFYVVFVVVWHWWLNQRRRRREQSAVARGHYTDQSTEDTQQDIEYRDEDDGPAGTRTPYSRHASMDDFRDLELADSDEPEYDELDEEVDRDKWMGELTSSMRITRTPGGERRSMFTPIRPSLIGALEFQSTLHSLRKSRNIQSIPIHLRRYSDDPTFTQAQQQQYAHSTTSDPQRASMLEGGFDGSEASESGSAQNEPAASARARAKSANAADLLRPGPSGWHRPRASGADIHGQRIAAEDLGVGEQALLGDGSPPNDRGPQINIHAPELTLSPPAIDDEDRDAHDGGILSSASKDLLALPQTGSQSSGGRRSTREDTHDSRRTRSGSNASQRGSSYASRRHSTVSSPFIAPQGDQGNTAFGIGQRCPSPESMYPTQSREEAEPKPLSWWPYKIFVPPEVIVRTLFPTLQSWREKNTGGKLIGIVSLPSFFLLTITLPVVEPQANASEDSSANKAKQCSYTSITSTTPLPRRHRESAAGINVSAEQTQGIVPDGKPNSASGPTTTTTTTAPDHPHAVVRSPHDWNRWLVIVQCYTAPYIVVLAIWANLEDAAASALLHPTLYSLLSSTVALAIILSTTTRTRPPRWHVLLTFVGFAVSITWISSIANEVVGVLKAIGIIFNISDAILGLTIFAVGNSLGDLVADITVARLGYPVMALSACFGGPMLNTLLGIGLSGLYMTISGADARHKRHPHRKMEFKPYKVEISITLLISAVALLVTLVGLLIVVPLNGWKMDRRIGWGLIVLWVIATAGNLGVELSGIADAT